MGLMSGTSSYRAVVILVSSADRADHQPAYERLDLLLNASSPEEAYDKAERHGKAMSTVTHGPDGPVFWSLLRVLDVRELDSTPADRPQYVVPPVPTHAA
ncbi:DUF4288 domain-containing protein [Allokutzneria sp. A3M-2-11 16]|uniref:DUF4288 domain-containing protein n=1 Tax=Allokutzneria sp. A3M-2-11 16 TaxID=2962043 RepID=UPI0020B6A377|nr:DUF4288 domain-containing protein [Allokutzneria sp. A3M-2-11 16]MCP3798681.1 DUF4288 domain-containing protein [Allokutzneria sp. A3M-2-11 16]